jgi:hypothetical protein
MMTVKAELKFGLLFGLAGLILNLIMAPILAACAPFIMLLAGGLAGYLTARQADLPLQSMGARAGAIAGLVAGGTIIIGQTVGGFLALAIYQASIFPNLVSYTPSPADPAWIRAFFYSTGYGVVACFGLFGVLLSVLIGAGVGYVTTNPYRFDN